MCVEEKELVQASPRRFDKKRARVCKETECCYQGVSATK